MSISVRAVKAAALLLILAAATMTAVGHAASRSATATVAAPMTSFVSKEYGYSFDLPGDKSRWIVGPARSRWTAGSLLPGDPQFDTLDDLASGRFFIVGARKQPAQSTLADWTRYFLSSQALACRRTSQVSRSTLGRRRSPFVHLLLL